MKAEGTRAAKFVYDLHVRAEARATPGRQRPGRKPYRVQFRAKPGATGWMARFHADWHSVGSYPDAGAAQQALSSKRRQYGFEDMDGRIWDAHGKQEIEG